jgi:hypothetical protein
VKKQVELIIVMIFGFSFLVYLFPFVFVEAAKLESGVTINAPTTTPPPAGTCPDTNGDGVPDLTGGVCTSPTGSTAETCELQIESGVPINYGQLNPGQGSAEQKVTIKNLGIGIAKIMIKGGNWISDAAGNPTISGPEITHVSMEGTGSIVPQLYDLKKPLTSNGSQIGLAYGGRSQPIYFQLWIPSSFSGFGSLHQEVSIDLIC